MFGQLALLPQAIESVQPERLVAIGVDEQNGPAGRFSRRNRQPGVGAEGYQMVALQRRHPQGVGNQAGESEEHRRRLPVGDQQPFDVEDFAVFVQPRLKQEILSVGKAGTVGMAIGMVDESDRQPSLRFFPTQPGEIFRVMGEPQAGNSEADGRRFARRFERLQEDLVEPPM